MREQPISKPILLRAGLITCERRTSLASRVIRATFDSSKRQDEPSLPRCLLVPHWWYSFEMPSLRRKAAPAHTSHSESSLSSAPESEDIDFGEKTGRSETALPSRPRRRGKRESATSTPAVAPIKKSARPQRRAARPAVKEEDSEDTFDEEKIVVNEEHITVENEANGAEAHVSEFEAEVDIKKKISKTRSPKKAGQRGKAQVKTEVVGEIKEEVFEVRTTTPKKSPKKRKAKQEAAQDQEEKPKVKRKRKTQEEKDAEAMPIAARTLGSKMYIGAHVSAAKGWWRMTSSHRNVSIQNANAESFRLV